MSFAFATKEQLFLRYPELSDIDAAFAEIKLSDASLSIEQAVKRHGKNIDEIRPEILSMVCCDIAARVINQSKAGHGMDISQVSTTVGSITEQYTLASSGGNCRPLRSDLENLGLLGGRIGFAFLGE